MITYCSAPGILVSKYSVARHFIKVLVLLLISIGINKDLLNAQSRQQFLEKRKAMSVDKSNRSYRTNVKPNSRLLRPNGTLCDFTLTPADASNNTLAQIIQSLVGNGITVSNIKTNLPATSDIYGSFSCGTSVVGIESGLILTSGSIQNVNMPNSFSGFTTENGLPGDTLLLARLTDSMGYDASIVSFDIVSNTNKISFQYVFASDEYNEFVGSEYNDVFGFFISGPGITTNIGIAGTQNIALVPNSPAPISINTVNKNLNSQYYINNEFEDESDTTRFYHLEYDGLTTVLTATATVQPGIKYTLTLAIEDVSDMLYDCGVFIKGGSITSGPCNMTLSAIPTPATCQGATNGSINLTIANAIAPVSIQWSNGATTEDISNLAPGTYTATVTDASPCQKILEVTVSAGSSTSTPSVIIAANPGNTICAGTNVTFTATPTNGGTTPTYQWKLNGNNVGTNSNIYQNTALTNGAKITCVMTSSLACANPTTATSNEITVAVTAAVAPSVSIAANPGNSICTGTSVTFTATPVNGGATPSYQWKLNGANVGTNSNTYQNAALTNGDKVTCVMTSSLACASPTTATSNEITMAVTAAVAPSVSIAANPGNTICTGTSVTFTATPTNGGATPTYQWKLNGVNVGTNSNTYQNAALVNGAKITCVMTSSLACVNPTTATSNEITMAVTAAVVPSVSIVVNPAGAICAGTNVTFTATPTNGGATPSYQWKLNGNNVGTNSNTYQNAALTNGAKITCVMTSSLACASPTTATSNEITMAVTAAVAPSVSIVANPGNSICIGNNVTFTATPTNGGATPTYQWKLNGANVGTNSNTYQNAALTNGAKITCVMTSSLACASPTTATSNEITMTVTAAVAPSVSIAANPGNAICNGTSVTFTATPVNGGATPSYQWKLNGNNVGTNSNTYQNATLANGAKITCVMTSSLACANPTTATSNEITMAVTAAVAPSVSIAANPDNTICTGTNVTFTATPTNGGATPTYQWKLNGNNVGSNSNTYQNAALVNGAKVTCVMTSSLACANPTTATSNEITMAVTAAVVPSVSIVANPGNTICTGTSVTFTATPTNGGATPSYQWKLNGANVGTNSNTYQNAALTNGSKITCVMTSSLACANPTNATSNEITMTVTALLTFYRDLDGDGYGNANSGTTQACAAPAGYVTNNTDCNDNNFSINPATTEICGNILDDNCNGQVDEGCTIASIFNPKIFLRTYVVREGNESEWGVTLKVLITKRPKQTISVRYTTENGTASAGNDYKHKEGIIQFAPGIKVATIPLTILGDQTKELHEMFYIRFSDPVNVTIPGDKRSRVIIMDDDKNKGKENPDKDVITSTDQITNDWHLDKSEIKVPSLLQRNRPLLISGSSNVPLNLHITDIRGVSVAQLMRYTNNWIPGNLASGIYFYQLIYRNQKGELQRKTGKIFITD
jgi:hypothetical protein